MKQLVAIYTEHRLCKVGVSLWGNGGHDKVQNIEWFSSNSYLMLWEAGIDDASGSGYLATTSAGREIFIKAEHVIAVEYQEVQDAEAGTT